MEDTSTLGWTEWYNHTDTAQKYMQKENSTHDITRYAQKHHVQELYWKNTSVFNKRQKNSTQKTNKAWKGEKSIEVSDTQAEDLIPVQVTCRIGHGVED